MGYDERKQLAENETLKGQRQVFQTGLCLLVSGCPAAL
jgi:hypothetical protein